MTDWRVVQGDCLEVMRGLDANSVDAVVTDPPAGIAFMNRTWDSDKGGRDAWIAWLADAMRGCYRAMKPGAHALVWAIPRTSHWTGMALEDAGFEVRDRLVHLFGSGFPKSHNLPGGIGTALKPAAEDWWLCRKPLSGTVAQTVAAWGTGGLNIDATRIAGNWTTWRRKDGSINPSAGFADEYVNGDERPTDVRNPEHPAGRWPANCVLSHHEDCREVGTRRVRGGAGTRCSNRDEQGKCRGHKNAGRSTSGETFHGPDSHDADGTEQTPVWDCHPSCPVRLLDEQSGAQPSRFFYASKASRREREAGLGDPRASHPTVKPLALMRWLCRLVPPPGGLVLDPFSGSGSTGCAAALEGFRFLGIEQEAEYVAIAERRIAHWAAQRSPREPELFAEPAA